MRVIRAALVALVLSVGLAAPVGAGPMDDEAEGVDRSPPLYRRRQTDAAGSPTWIYLYARPLEGTLKIDSGDWIRRY